MRFCCFCIISNVTVNTMHLASWCFRANTLLQIDDWQYLACHTPEHTLGSCMKQRQRLSASASRAAPQVETHQVYLLKRGHGEPTVYPWFLWEQHPRLCRKHYTKVTVDDWWMHYLGTASQPVGWKKKEAVLNKSGPKRVCSGEVSCYDTHLFVVSVFKTKESKSAQLTGIKLRL